ncbi:MAG TPA: hypothetical protein VFU02_07325 [Polyangiaceae bacterium]|nr:hypothetical protein [Polyangiaceae bacterium]
MAEERSAHQLRSLAERDEDAFRSALGDVEPKLLESLVDELERANLYRAVEITYRELIRRDPDNQDFYRWLGLNLYYHQRAAARAEAFLREALAKFPDNTEIALTCATNLAWGLGRHEQALPLLRATVERAPENAVYRGVYGWCLLWLGEIEQGLAEVRLSLECKEDQEDELRLADHLYLYLLGDRATQASSLPVLKKLVRGGVELEDWDVSRLVMRAKEGGHPESAWLLPLVEVVSGKAKPATLRAWPAWDEAELRPSAAGLALRALHAYEQAPPPPSKVVVPSRRDFLARYQAGEHEAWDELVRHAVFASQHPDVLAEAHAVAEALMRRVRQNTDAVRATLTEAGARLADERAPASPRDTARLVATTGPLPVALAAFWKVVGSIDLLPPYSRDHDYGYGDCSLEEEGISLLALDPLSIDGVDADRLIDAYEDDSDQAEADEVRPLVFTVAPDFLHKQNISGGSPYEIELPPTNVFDALDPDVLNEAHDTSLVGYLRACFEYGGFPLLRVGRLPMEEIHLNDRIAFEGVGGPWGPPAERLRERLCRNTVGF